MEFYLAFGVAWSLLCVYRFIQWYRKGGPPPLGTSNEDIEDFLKDIRELRELTDRKVARVVLLLCLIFAAMALVVIWPLAVAGDVYAEYQLRKKK